MKSKIKEAKKETKKEGKPVPQSTLETLIVSNNTEINTHRRISFRQKGEAPSLFEKSLIMLKFSRRSSQRYPSNFDLRRSKYIVFNKADLDHFSKKIGNCIKNMIYDSTIETQNNFQRESNIDQEVGELFNDDA